MIGSFEIKGNLLARNTLFNLVGQGLPLIVAIATMPVVIRGLGTERFGVLALAWVVLGYFNIFNLGLGRATTKFIAEALGNSDENRIAAITWTSVITQAGLGILGVFILSVITPFLVSHIFNVPAGLLTEAKYSFYLLAISIPFVLVSTSFLGVLQAAQRFDLVNAVRTPYSASNFLLPLIGVLLGWNLPKIVALLIIARFLALVFYYRLSCRIFPSLRKLPRFQKNALHALVSFGGWATVSSIVNPILVYFDRITIGALLTMIAVTYYSAPYEMVTRLWIIPSSLVAALFPAFSTLGGQRQWRRIETLMSRSIKYVLLSLGPVVVIIVACSREILQIWLGAEFAEKSLLALQILAIGVLINSLAYGAHSLIQALGRPDLTAKLHVAELPLHIILVWGLVSIWGIAGAALAWSIRVCVDTLLLFVLSFRLSPISPRVLLADRVPQSALLLLIFSCFVAGIDAVRITIWLRFLLLSFGLLVGAVAMWHYLLDDKDRAQITGLLAATAVK